MDSRLELLLDQPDVVNVIADYLDPQSIINWSATSSRFQLFFTESHRLKLTRDVINQFFTLVIFALPKLSVVKDDKIVIFELNNLLKLYPELLTYRRTIKDYKGRIFVDRTGYQILLAYAADNLYPMMEKHFHTLPHGAEEMKKQFKEQFPDGVIKAYPKYNIEEARAAFRKAKELIQSDGRISYRNGEGFRFLKVMSNATRKAIDDFFTIIQSHNEYSIGLVNDMQLYKEAKVIYYDKREMYKFTDPAQQDAYCVFLLGGLQALFAPNILQVFMQGCFQVIDQGNSLANVTKIRFGEYDVSPFDIQSKLQLGKHFFLNYYGGGHWIAPPASRQDAWLMEKCYQAKITRLEQLMHGFNNFTNDESAADLNSQVTRCGN